MSRDVPLGAVDSVRAGTGGAVGQPHGALVQADVLVVAGRHVHGQQVEDRRRAACRFGSLQRVAEHVGEVVAAVWRGTRRRLEELDERGVVTRVIDDGDQVADAVLVTRHLQAFLEGAARIGDAELLRFLGVWSMSELVLAHLHLGALGQHIRRRQGDEVLAVRTEAASERHGDHHEHDRQDGQADGASHVDHLLPSSEDEGQTSAGAEATVFQRSDTVRHGCGCGSTVPGRDEQLGCGDLQRQGKGSRRAAVIQLLVAVVVDVVVLTMEAGHAELPVVTPPTLRALSRGPVDCATFDVVVGEPRDQVVADLVDGLTVVEQLAAVALDRQIEETEVEADHRAVVGLLGDGKRLAADESRQADIGDLQAAWRTVLQPLDALAVIAQLSADRRQGIAELLARDQVGILTTRNERGNARWTVDDGQVDHRAVVLDAVLVHEAAPVRLVVHERGASGSEPLVAQVVDGDRGLGVDLVELGRGRRAEEDGVLVGPHGHHTTTKQLDLRLRNPAAGVPAFGEIAVHPDLIDRRSIAVDDRHGRGDLGGDPRLDVARLSVSRADDSQSDRHDGQQVSQFQAMLLLGWGESKSVNETGSEPLPA